MEKIIQNISFEKTLISRQRGVTLVEALFVIGIMTILIGVVVVILSQTSQRQKDIQTISELLNIENIMHQLYQSQPTYDGMTISDLLKSGLLPARYISGSKVIDAYGGEIQIWPHYVNSSSTIEIQISNAPRQLCEKIASYNWGNDVVSLTLNGSTNLVTTGNQVTSYNLRTSISNCYDNGNFLAIDFL